MVGSIPPTQDGSCKSEFMWIPYLLTVVIMVVTVTGWGVNPNNRAMFVPCFTFYNCGRVVLEWIFFRSSNTTTGGDDWSGYDCDDVGGCWDQYGGVIGKAVGNVAQAIRIDGDL